MRLKKSIGVAVAMLVLAASATSQRAEALSCYVPSNEMMELELESVTEDGVELTDTTAYDPFVVHVEGNYSEPGFKLFAIKGAKDSWREDYQ